MRNALFTSILSGLTLSVTLMTPAFAETISTDPNDRELINHCRQTHLPAYRASIREVVEDLQNTFTNQWERQVNFRIRAARPAQQASVRRALQTAGNQLALALTQFNRTETPDTTVNTAIDLFARFDGEQEDANLERWSRSAVSYQTLNTALTRLERNLHTYANARDRVTITRVWGDTRRQAQNAFTQARTEARSIFVEDMRGCIAGDATEEEMGSDVNTDIIVDSNNVSSSETSTSTFSAHTVKIETVASSNAGCAQRVLSRADIYTTGVGRVRGYFVYQDGQRSSEMTLDTDGSGHALAQHERTLRALSTNMTLEGNVKFIVISPNLVNSDPAPFTVRCQGTSTQNTATNTTQTRAEATLVLDGPARVTACGTYPFTFTGTISYNGIGDVRYYWHRSDGQTSPTYTANFTGPGTKVLSYQWPTRGTSEGWIKLFIVSPNETSSQQVNITLINPCGTDGQLPGNAPVNQNNEIISQIRAEATNADVQGPSTVTTCGTYPFSFQGTITSTGAGRVSYYWLRNNNERSETREIEFSGAGTRSVTHQWPLSGNWSGVVQLVVTSPNESISPRATFTLLEAPACVRDQQNSDNVNANNEPIARAEASLAVQGPSTITTCGQYPFSFRGTITLNRAATVQYYWLRSDGGRSATESITFEAAGTRTVNYNWNVGIVPGAFNGSVELVIVSPNAANTRAAFTANEASSCAGSTSSNNEAMQPSVSAVTATLESRANVTTCGQATFTFKGTIITSRATDVRYQWERNNGVTSPVQTLSFSSAGSRTVTETWTTEATNMNGSVRLRVLSPNDISSSSANFTLTQSCS